MVKPTINPNVLSLDMEGADKVWSLKSHLEISLQHITGVRVDSEIVKKWYHGLRAPGTSVPRVITAGTFYQAGQRVFWDIHHPEQAVIISLKDERYNELAIEVENPDIFVAQLKQALNRPD
jgi:hypothetical protein